MVQFFRKLKLKDWRVAVFLSVPALVLLFVSGYLAVNLYRQQSKHGIKTNEILVSSVITADGRLEHQGETIILSAPYRMERSRVKKLMIKRGDRIKARDVVAILDSNDVMRTVLHNAKAREQVALAELLRVKAGAKAGEIEAQKARVFEIKAELNGQINTQKARIANLKAQLEGEWSTQQATIERIEAELINTERECERYRSLHQDGAVSTSQMESECLEKDVTKKSLDEAEANLNRIINSRQEQIREAEENFTRTIATVERQIEEIEATFNATAEVRPVDVAVAEAELAAARTTVAQATANFELTFVRSPMDGQILEIHTRPGELVSQGIADLGHTDVMLAVAEVYETDIDLVQLGQKAKISSPALTNPLSGVVSEIGLEVGQKDILNDDPVIAADARVVEVRILLDEQSSKVAAKLINLKVDVTIEI